MSLSFFDQVDADFSQVYSESGEFTKQATIAYGTDSQTAYGILFKPLDSEAVDSGFKRNLDGDWFVTFNEADITVALDEDDTTITIDGRVYGVRKVDPPHNDTITVYLK